MTALGAAGAAASLRYAPEDPGAVDQARKEIAYLKEDFEALRRMRDGRPASQCNLHRRIYNFVKMSGMAYLYSGTYSEIKDEGVPEERADYFLDPWNSPYWLRDRCDEEATRRVIFVYSPGPNRRRESTPWEIGGGRHRHRHPLSAEAARLKVAKRRNVAPLLEAWKAGPPTGYSFNNGDLTCSQLPLTIGRRVSFVTVTWWRMSYRQCC